MKLPFFPPIKFTIILLYTKYKISFFYVKFTIRLLHINTMSNLYSVSTNVYNFQTFWSCSCYFYQISPEIIFYSKHNVKSLLKAKNKMLINEWRGTPLPPSPLYFVPNFHFLAVWHISFQNIFLKKKEEIVIRWKLSSLYMCKHNYFQNFKFYNCYF